MAALSLERGHTEEALALHTKLIEQGERAPELLYNTGLLYQKSGRLEQAAQLYKGCAGGLAQFRRGFAELGHRPALFGARAGGPGSVKRAVELKPELAHGYFG